MKKSLALLPLLLFAVTACNNSGPVVTPETPSGDSQPGGQTDIDKLLSYVTLFPEVGDQIDLDEYATEEMDGHSLSQYTFTSSDNNIIEIQGYKAVCKAGGYAKVTVEGPGLETPLTISFWTGSIAGEYKPYYPKSLKDKITLNIGAVNDERISEFSLHINEGSFRNTKFKEYDGAGTLFKNGSPFVVFEFDGAEPKNFSPISGYLTSLGLTGDIAGLADNVYGYLDYDFDTETLVLKTIFCGYVVEFEVQ